MNFGTLWKFDTLTLPPYPVVADEIQKDMVTWSAAILGYVKVWVHIIVPYWSHLELSRDLLWPQIQPSKRGIHCHNPQANFMGRCDRTLCPLYLLQHRNLFCRCRNRPDRHILSQPTNWFPSPSIWEPCYSHLFWDTLRCRYGRTYLGRTSGLSPDAYTDPRWRGPRGCEKAGDEIKGEKGVH